MNPTHSDKTLISFFAEEKLIPSFTSRFPLFAASASLHGDLLQLSGSLMISEWEAESHP